MSQHYFSSRPGSTRRGASFEATVWGHRMHVQSASGVFSHGRLDVGTRVLVRSETPRETSRTVLDLGCGSGVLALGLGLALPAAQVWAVDVNERARALTTANGATHGLGDRLRVAEPDGVPGSVTFDEIWSNPPIRIGKSAVRELLQRWLPRLAPGGRAVAVIGRNLGADSYQRWLVEQGWRCARLASAKGFRVLEVSGGPGCNQAAGHCRCAGRLGPAPS